ncbi:Na(+)/H(+) antiporter subunit C [Rhodococcus rhodnii]|uniref:Na(+)/H(+) antiporter subunit C n=2 Tax=Rhodococcus rhodnii TaxID=38312 RepID=A0A6P2CM26_9NOCA|nr:Na(+)/H(+) antiporter subunit C [Rhodococcus rhodnii]EOM77963.1 putative multisubunit sodium/proton antiporter [Rhodococcus rhodnii LMG 5362]TXG92038.1 Na(+)/H(+) antiporter subunit C [Rhodococcus rhodnii]
MIANITMLATIAALVSCGVYLIVERSVTRMLLGLLLIGNGINLLIITAGGASGGPPIVFFDDDAEMADPLAQAMVLTAIVITMGIAAFVLALIYRSYKLSAADTVEDDPEDTRVIRRRSVADAPDRDRSDDPVTGAPRFAGDAFDKHGNPIPIEQIESLHLEDLEGYEDLHEGTFDDDEDEIDRYDAGDMKLTPDPGPADHEPAAHPDDKTDPETGDQDGGDKR